MNKIIILGYLTDKTETKATNQGTKYSKFCIAVNDDFKKEEVDFFNATAWNYNSDFAENYLKKGDLVLVEGRMKQNKYVNKENKNVVFWNIAVEKIKKIKSKNVNPEEKKDEIIKKYDKPEKDKVEVNNFDKKDVEWY